ncbi:MAG: threonine--tRNA ligase [Candidatus Fermentibacteraceae bacterium]|nr:threonine--tRNA ligase [Candidatus Fermentibacteraceae bacterium]
MRILFPDSSSKNFEAGTTGLEIASDISRGLARNALLVRFNGRLLDLEEPLEDDGSIEILTFSDEEGRRTLRHSCSHLMAGAVQKLFPGTILGIGPAIDDGFYYDMRIPDFPGISAFEDIAEEMRRQVKEDIPFIRMEMSCDEALELFRERGESFKLELLDELREAGENISVYRHGDFVDLCRGPHVPSTGYLRNFQLLSTAGAYWKGDEKNPMLTRIYGTVFDSSKSLNAHLEMLEESRKRDHRKLGPELGLFAMGGEGGPGLAYWLPAGTIVREELESHWKKAHVKAGYQLVSTPHIAPAELWKTSGHYDYYHDNMYFLDVDKGEYALKPMNCPGHILIYKNSRRSYRELPMRLAELGVVYRCEKSGVLHGLMRVRGFTVDDGHIFCTGDQIVDEIQKVVRFALYFLRIFDFGYSIELSLMDPEDPERYAGEPEEWRKVEPALARALNEMGEDYRTVTGEAAFYGPKIDIKLRDALGRYWQGPTIQFDFNIPQRFNLTYVGDDGGEHRVYMVHRALFGSVERFIGNLIEHYAGNLPGWLAPTQVVILPITETQLEKADETGRIVSEAGLRCMVNGRNETVGYRIREAETGKIPFMFIIGEREAESDRVALRVHGEGDRGSMELDLALEIVKAGCRRPELPE